ncbi:hypothetical protein ACU4GD_28100 [Cupriavidus basilensis]
MTFYQEMAETADELLREYGKQRVLRRLTPGQYDPDTGTVTEAVEDFPGTAALFDFELQSAGQAFAPGSLIQIGDKQCLLSPIGMPQPVIGNLLLDGAEVWQVMNVKTVNPAGTPVLHELHLRR